MARTIVLVSERGDDEMLLTDIATIAQAQLKVYPNAHEAVSFISKNESYAVFIDVNDINQLRTFESEVQQRLGLFNNRVESNRIHYMSDTDMSSNRDVILSPLFGSFFQRPFESVNEVAKSYGRFVLASERRSTHDLGHFLDEKAKIQKVALKNTGQKQEAVEAVRQYLIAAKVKPRISNLIANAVDELLMNALFDAPCDEFGKPLFSITNRKLDRELTPKERVTLSLGFDGHVVGISVTDNFGSVDKNRLLAHVIESYRSKDYVVKTGQAGAGLGIATIFNTGGSLIYHCEANVKTEATLLYRASSSFRSFKNQFKFFSAKFYL